MTPKRFVLHVGMFALLGCSSAETVPSSSAGQGGSGSASTTNSVTASATSTSSGGGLHDRLFVGTGEYSATPDWHGILRFEDAFGADPMTPDATIPMKQTTDAAGTKLLFEHSFFVHEGRDEMYVSTLFTNSANKECMPCDPMDPTQPGSIAVLQNISTVDGPQTVARHIFGGDDPVNDKTGLVQPHGVWVDVSHDELYVANTFGKNILVFADAAHANGNTPPTRTIYNPGLGTPVFVFVDEVNDWLFVASMPSPPEAPEPQIAIFRDASTLNGNIGPHLQLHGPNTRIGAGNNQTTHNVWYDRDTQLMFVGHHTNEVLIFDMKDVDFQAKPPVHLDLAPRVIDVSTSDADVAQWSVYGLFYVPEVDRLYVATGFAMGGPQAGTPPNAVLVFDGVSSPSVMGRAEPTQRIHWGNGDTYFPPQPLWVTRH